MSGSTIRASAVLRRRVKGEDRTASGDGDGDDAYWAVVPRLYDFSKHEDKREQPASPSLEPAPTPCLLAGLLQGGGVGWAVKKRVRYVGGQRARGGAGGDAAGLHHDGGFSPAADAIVESEAAAAAMMTDEESSCNSKKRERPDSEQEEADERKVAMTEKRRKRRSGHGWHAIKRRRPKKIPPPEEAEAEESSQEETPRKRTTKAGHGGRSRGATERPKKTRRVKEVACSPRAMVDRWAGERYAAAEASLLGVLRKHGARAGQSVSRGKLRQEAREHIGDTGLLDHLLKHVAGRVTPGGAERTRRRHNADGGMEYWLEPAGLAALRREAGVEDPYWVPPSGWKPGDPLSPDACALQVKTQLEVLSSELAGVKRHMDQFIKAHQGTPSKNMKSEICIAYHQPCQGEYECMVKNNGDLENQVISLEEKFERAARTNAKLEEDVLFLKEKYDAVLEKNTRLEEQMAHLCTSLLNLKESLLLLNAGEHHRVDLMQKQDGDGGGGGAAPEDAAAGDGDGMASSSGVNSTTGGGGGGGGGGKRTSRKCSMRICKPQGTFQWPDAAPSSPVTPTTGANLGYTMAGGGLPPTPPSVSSKKLPLPPPLPPSPAASPAADFLLAPRSAGLELQLRRRTDTSSSSSPAAPCRATASLPEAKKTALDAAAAAADRVGTSSS